MKVFFPVQPQTQAGMAMQIVLARISEAFASVVTTNKSCERVIMRAPGGQNFIISVTDAGVVTTTSISGKNREI